MDERGRDLAAYAACAPFAGSPHAGSTHRGGLLSQYTPAAWLGERRCCGALLEGENEDAKLDCLGDPRIYHIKELMIRRELEKERPFKSFLPPTSHIRSSNHGFCL